MSTNLPGSDIYSFFEFLGRRLEAGSRELTPEESVAAFRDYQNQLDQFTESSNESLNQANRGESRPLDHVELMSRVRKRFSESQESD